MGTWDGFLVAIPSMPLSKACGKGALGRAFVGKPFRGGGGNSLSGSIPSRFAVAGVATSGHAGKDRTLFLAIESFSLAFFFQSPNS